MDLVRIIRLFQRNLILLIGVPLVLVVIVKYLTRNPTLKFESETSIYTGLASGYSLDQNKGFNLFATNNMFDNLINIIKSREVAAETGIRLFTKCLMLEQLDPSIILKVNYDALHARTPEHIKRLLMRPSEGSQNQAIHRRNANNDSIRLNNGDVVYQGRLFHKTKPDETIFTLARQYGIAVSELMDMNALTTYYLNPGIMLIIKDANRSTGSQPVVLFDSMDIRKDKNINNELYERNVEILMQYAYANDTNYIYGLLNSGNPYYAIRSIQSVTVRRVQSSDLINIKYTSFDPGLCRQTLLILTDVFINRFRMINENQSDAVVRYFMNEVNKASVRLRKAEDQLLEFNKANNIINYYEQSKAVANMKEQLDMEYNNEQVRFGSAAAVLTRLEEKLEVQERIQLKTSEIVEIRNKLSEVTAKITLTEVYNDQDPKNRKKLEELRAEASKLKKGLENYVEQLYSFTNSIEGLPLNELLNTWLKNVIVYEESRAAMQVLANRIKEFYEYYKTFAPLGATQKRIEREINVAEQEYLSLLQSLNQSKLKQQNIELSSNIKAVDPPYFPLKPLKGKEGILVIAAGLFGFLFVAFLIIALEYLDNTIRTPERLEELSKLRLAGVYPKILSRYFSYNLPFISNRLIEIAAHSLKLNLRESRKRPGPGLILVFSPLKKEGKTYLGARIAHKLREFGEKTAFITFVHPSAADTNEWLFELSEDSSPESLRSDDLRKKATSKPRQKIIKKKTGQADNKVPPPPPHEDNFRFLFDNNYADVNSLNELNFIDRRPLLSEFHNIILEIPGIIYNPYPIDLIAQVDASLLVVRSNRSWKKADTLALTTMVKILKDKPIALLNGVEIEVLDSVLGDLPKRRSRFRRLLKRILTMQLHEKQVL
jgi:uncharacterized protein involved in exopolysaccharide biosynthesis/LysM repeat protein